MREWDNKSDQKNKSTELSKGREEKNTKQILPVSRFDPWSGLQRIFTALQAAAFAATNSSRNTAVVEEPPYLLYPSTNPSLLLQSLQGTPQNWHEVPSLCLCRCPRVTALRLTNAGGSSSSTFSRKNAHSSSFMSATFTKLTLAGSCSFALLCPEDE